MHLSLRLAIPVILALAVISPVRAADPTPVFPGKTWTYAETPESVGWSSDTLKWAENHADSVGTTEVMIVHRGIVVGAWGDLAARSEAYSVRKSVLSALFGIAVGKGQIDISQTLAALGIDDNAPLTPAEKQATVADLLKARSGVYHPALYETKRMARQRPARGSHPPGSFWYYNNWDFNTLATIYETETGEKIFEAVAKHLAGPLEMQDFRPKDGRYVTGKASIHAAYPMRLSARDLARLGLLYLRKGCWRDKQILSADWVADSTAEHSDLGKGRSYGYMWWGLRGTRCFPTAKPEDRCYFAAGNYGQYVVVIPVLDLVIVHRVNTDVTRKAVKRRAVGELVATIVKAGEKAFNR